MRSNAAAATLALLVLTLGSAVSADDSAGLIAVLEFKNKLQGDEAKTVDASYFTDVVRTAALHAAPHLRVMTRENETVLLQATGRKLEDCEGECEVDTGRRLGADYVISGDILKVGTKFKLNLRMHETHSGQLLAGAVAEGHTVDELDSDTNKAVESLVGPLKTRVAAVVEGPPTPGEPRREPRREQAQARTSVSGVFGLPALSDFLKNGESLSLDAGSAALSAYEAAMEADARGSISPDEAVAAWEKLANIDSRNPYKREATERFRQWKTWNDKRLSIENKRKGDLDKLRTVLSDTSASEDAKEQEFRDQAKQYGIRALLPILDTAQPLQAKVDLFSKACYAGASRACTRMGNLEKETSKDATRSAQFFQRAAALSEKSCEQGDWADCNDLGDMYRDGVGVTKDEAKAATLYQKACDGGDSLGCRNTALAYQSGRGVALDASKATTYYKKAATLHEKACDSNDPHACNALAAVLRAGQWRPKDEAKALSLYEKACALGDLSGCTSQGEMVREGVGGPADDKKAAEIFKRACRLGDGSGCNDFGLLVLKSNELTRAAVLFERACDRADASGCANLAASFQYGRGMPENPTKTVRYYDRSCELGEMLGCSNLGFLYQNGRSGVPADTKKAAGYFQRSCDLGRPQACLDLGTLYQQGEGVPRNVDRAQVLFKKACGQGLRQACDKL